MGYEVLPMDQKVLWLLTIQSQDFCYQQETEISYNLKHLWHSGSVGLAFGDDVAEIDCVTRL